ncbi:MAG: glutamine-hydrolyzing carbamoyl-phosphate synthase small subunit [Actinomycetota bacterium]
MKPAVLVLEDGEVFEGVSFGADSEALGEVVFNTSLSGYQEVLTDPSYDGQIVVMTYPHIGNYGVNGQDAESHRVWVKGFVIRDLPVAWSSWRGEQSLQDYLESAGIAGITEIDTRRLTRHIREKGAMRGAISRRSPREAIESVAAAPVMAGSDLTGNVTTPEPYKWEAHGEKPIAAPDPEGIADAAQLEIEAPRFSVAAYDFGIKHNILRLLSAHGCEVSVYPASTPASQILAGDYDGVFISNGPGDPEAVGGGIESVRRLIGKVPVFGICLGHQLIALAAGLTTYKLRFGHRGINHPVARLSDGSVAITTQNHGFAVAEAPFGFTPPSGPGDPLPRDAVARTAFGKAQLTHLNLNDYTVEGFRLLDEPVFAVQYHPEAGPGPHDSNYLFEDFCRLMEESK